VADPRWDALASAIELEGALAGTSPCEGLPSQALVQNRYIEWCANRESDERQQKGAKGAAALFSHGPIPNPCQPWLSADSDKINPCPNCPTFD
jgi:hypothetical protein